VRLEVFGARLPTEQIPERVTREPVTDAGVDVFVERNDHHVHVLCFRIVHEHFDGVAPVLTSIGHAAHALVVDCPSDLHPCDGRPRSTRRLNLALDRQVEVEPDALACLARDVVHLCVDCRGAVFECFADVRHKRAVRFRVELWYAVALQNIPSRRKVIVADPNHVR